MTAPRDETWWDRLLRRQVIMRANPLALEKRYPMGALVEVDGQWWRVVKHKWFMTTPDATIRVYGRRTQSPA